VGYESVSNNADELRRIEQMLNRRIDEKEKSMVILIEQRDRVRAKLASMGVNLEPQSC
jgi:hypothetical protein